MSDQSASQKTWGGRFRGAASDLMTRINASIRFDKRLWREDIAGSKAHASMLRDQGIIAVEDAQAILKGLDRIAEEFERDGVPVDAYGVGSSLIRGQNDFTADVVMTDGRPSAKEGRRYSANPRLELVS